MSDNPVSLRGQHFTRHWQLWASLHHFLSAPLLRELLVVIVEQVSSRSLAFGDLFDDAVSASRPEMATWLLRLRDINDDLASYLQRRIHSILWQQDTTCYVPTD